MPTHEMKPCPCPNCGAMNDAATSASGDASAPEAGDISICLYCASPLQYAEDMSLVDLDVSTLSSEEKVLVYEATMKVKWAIARHKIISNEN